MNDLIMNELCLNPLFDCKNEQVEDVLCCGCKEDWDSFHDIYFDVEGTSLGYKGLIDVYLELPIRIQNMAKEWGISDTFFRDSAYGFFIQKKEK